MSLGRSNLCVIEGRNHLKNFQSWTEAKVKFGSHRNLTRISLTEEETPSTKEDFSVEFKKTLLMLGMVGALQWSKISADRMKQIKM